MRPILVFLLVAVAAISLAGQRRDAFQVSADHPSIAYSKGAVRDRVAQLDRKLEAGTARLTFDATAGYLPSVLAALNVRPESQALVFSQTSAQAERITVT